MNEYMPWSAIENENDNREGTVLEDSDAPDEEEEMTFLGPDITLLNDKMPRPMQDDGESDEPDEKSLFKGLLPKKRKRNPPNVRNQRVSKPITRHVVKKRQAEPPYNSNIYWGGITHK